MNEKSFFKMGFGGFLVVSDSLILIGWTLLQCLMVGELLLIFFYLKVVSYMFFTGL